MPEEDFRQTFDLPPTLSKQAPLLPGTTKFEVVPEPQAESVSAPITKVELVFQKQK